MESGAQHDPDDDVVVLTEAFHARRRGDYPAAREGFLRVYERDRENPWPLIETARVEFLRSDFLAMRGYLKRATDLAAGDPEVWRAAAAAWMDCLDPEECLRAAERGQELAPADERFLARRLLALERLNRIAEATALIEAFGELPPGCRLAAARVFRRAGRIEQAKQLIAGDRSPGGLMERARVLDRSGKPRLAIESMMEAKRQLAAHPESEYERRLTSLHLQKQQRERDLSPPERILQWVGERPGAALPIAFLIGHPRSGTTLLESLIERRGGAAIASEFPVLETAIRLWVQDLATRDTTVPPLHKNEGLAALRESYWRQTSELAASGPGQWVIDKNPGVTDGVQWVAKIFPESKILTALRDPRDVIVSCMFQDFGFSRLGVACLSWEGAARSWAGTMGHWVEMRGRLPADRWREIHYEELVRDPDRVVGSALEFLGLSDSQPVSPERLIRTPSYPDAAGPVHSGAVARWKSYERWLKPLRPIIEPVMTRLGYEW